MTLTDGGLGAGMWKGTSRLMVERFMPQLVLPSPYATMNNLAGRFLLTTAGSPEGSSTNAAALTALRISKLIELGDGADAWKLASLSSEQLNEATLMQTAEAALVTPVASDVCSKLPTIMKKYVGAEWSKLLVVCQLQANDTKAAQVSLDFLHTQDVHDDPFLTLAEKNIIAGNKQLPRQLTPLKPILLALLRLTDLPARGEIYARPDAVLIPELLKAKAADDLFRLSLTERAAFKGLIGTNDLIAVYKSEQFTPDILSSAAISGEHGAMLRALLYQAAMQEKTAKNRAALAIKFMQSLDAATTGGNILPLPAIVLGELQPSSDYNTDSANIARIYVLGGKAGLAPGWIELARGASRGMPQVATDISALWPLIALNGMEADANFGNDLDKWMAATLRTGDPQDSDVRASKNLVGSIMMLLDATGSVISEDQWAKVADNATPEKISSPPTLIMNRLRDAGIDKRKGEVILFSLLATTGTAKDDPSLLAGLETIHALRAAGLAPEAGLLARDVGLRVLNANNK